MKASGLSTIAVCLGLFFQLTGQIKANTPGGGSEGQDVTMVMAGKNVVLANGIVTATINPTSATIVSLRYQGNEMISQAGRHQDLYFFLDGDKGYERFSTCVLSVKQQTPDRVDISCNRVYDPQNPKMHPCDLDIHFVLGRGMSGLYVYSTLSHSADYPDFNVGQYLMIWSMPEVGNQWLMENIYVDEARHWELPAPDDFAKAEQTGIKEIVKLTTGSWQGKYDCKYMYTASYWDLGCWGFAGNRNKIGAWVVFGSHEFFNDGPTMSDLTAAAGITQLMFNMNHYNGSNLQIPHGTAWQKIYGPYLLYCNSSPDGGDACWADAKRQADAEKAAWPYDWLANEKLYPLKQERGVVSGRFVVKDPLKPNVSSAGAWVGLDQPDPVGDLPAGSRRAESGGNWQFDGRHYQYWVHADTNGNFSIPNIRPGTYTLYAFTTGAVGEFSQANITVKAAEATPLGDVTWTVPHPGASIAWEIGVPDRTAQEFRHGDDYYQPYMWEKFAAEFSNPLEYTVGVSDWRKDWNYVQCGYLSGTTWSPWKWRINFTLSNPPASGNATLTIAYASSYYGRTEIYVNDETKLFKMVIPAIDGGNALIREGIHAKYCVEQIPIPMSLLKKSANTITLIQGGDRFNRPFFHVMYDYLSLELPPGG
jgi:rhamnogalacturonan endolyase